MCVKSLGTWCRLTPAPGTKHRQADNKEDREGEGEEGRGNFCRHANNRRTTNSSKAATGGVSRLRRVLVDGFSGSLCFSVSVSLSLFWALLATLVDVCPSMGFSLFWTYFLDMFKGKQGGTWIWALPADTFGHFLGRWFTYVCLWGSPPIGA